MPSTCHQTQTHAPSLSLDEIAQLVNGKLTGDGSVQVTGAGTIRDCQPGDITLADDPELAKKVAACSAVAVLAVEGCAIDGIPCITVSNAHDAFAKVVAHFRPTHQRRPIGVSDRAAVCSTATIGRDVEVHPFATIGEGVEIGDGSCIHAGVHLMAGCRIGENVTIFPNAVLHENTVVGDRSIIHAGAVLGAYGFGYDSTTGRHELSPQLGHVEIECDVEIGANSTVDRGTYGATTIGAGTKIDNQVMVAHNCRIGKHNLLCSQVGIAGSSTTGDYVVMGGQVGVRDHVDIGDLVQIGAKSGVVGDLETRRRYLGTPAVPERETKLMVAAMSKLPQMRKQMKRLERTVEGLVEGHVDGLVSKAPAAKDAA